MVRTALIRGGMEHISLGDLCREERRENEDARLLAYAAEKGTISRSEAMSLLGHVQGGGLRASPAAG